MKNGTEPVKGIFFSQVNHTEEIVDLYNCGYSMNEVSQATIVTRCTCFSIRQNL